MEDSGVVRILSITRKMVKQRAQSSDMSDCVYGTVLSVSPLSVQLDSRTTLGENQLVVGALCKETIIKIPFPEKGQVKHNIKLFIMVCTIPQKSFLRYNYGVA